MKVSTTNLNIEFLSGHIIKSKVISLIYLDLMIYPTHEWVFVTVKEYNSIIEDEKINIIRDELEKNKSLIQEIANKIITNYDSRNLRSKNMLEIIYD